MQQKTTGRLPAADWLRTYATVLLIIFHCAQTFDATPFYHLKAPKSISWMHWATLGCRSWHMPLFFFLAGWSLRKALLHASCLSVLKERSRKLLPPLLTSTLLLGPYLRWTEARHGLMKALDGSPLKAEPQSFAATCWEYWTHPEQLNWAHLWFLAYLWTFTVLYMPVLLILPRTPRLITSKLAARIMVLQPFLLLAFAEVHLRERWPGYQNLVDDWANFACFSIFFVIGFVIALSPMCSQALAAQGPLLLGLGVHSNIQRVKWMVADGMPPKMYGAPWLAAASSWAMVAGIFGTVTAYGPHLQAPKPLIRLSYPCYVIHQGVVVALAEFVVFAFASALWPVGQFALLTVLGFAGTFAAVLLVSLMPLGPQLMFGMPFFAKQRKLPNVPEQASN